jgi:hypothetical protein
MNMFSGGLRVVSFPIDKKQKGTETPIVGPNISINPEVIPTNSKFPIFLLCVLE